MHAPAKAVRVAVRCRPALSHDRDKRICVRALDEREIEVLDPEHLHGELREKHGRPDYLKELHCRERAYTFDSVFGPESANGAIFERIVAPLVPEVLAGKHATCFAYGQTGSGKTHTMLGRKGEMGLVERTLVALLGQAREDVIVSISFVEVYNEKIRDLLSASPTSLELRDDPVRGSTVAGVKEMPAKTAEGVMELVSAGNGRRSEERTAANPVSSRSHAVLQLVVESPIAASGGGPKRVRTAKLSMIDLAGSERAANTGNKGARLREGAMINKSLLALSNCITALTRKGAYVNYRDSKLTRLLKDSLSGNCYTVMVAHVSPSIASFEETLNTLKYAHRACEIRGLGGGVRENVAVVAAQYADRMQPCVEATNVLKNTISRLASAANSAPGSRAVEIVDALEKTRLKVLDKMRERVRIEQTALELDHQNEVNAIELSKLELNAMQSPGAPLKPPGPSEAAEIKAAYQALRDATRRNGAEKHRIEKQAERVKFAEGLEEVELVSLLTEAKSMIDIEGVGSKLENVEKRLLQAQHANTVLEIEKVQAEQQKVVIEAAARRHELAFRKQSFQLDVHRRAFVCAQKLLARHGLADELNSLLGPLASLRLLGNRPPAPSVDDLIAELNDIPPNSPIKGVLLRMPDLSFTSPSAVENASEVMVGDEFHVVDSSFDEMRQTLRESVKLTFTDVDEAEDDMKLTEGGSERDEDEEALGECWLTDDEEVDVGTGGSCSGVCIGAGDLVFGCDAGVATAEARPAKADATPAPSGSEELGGGYPASPQTSPRCPRDGGGALGGSDARAAQLPTANSNEPKRVDDQ